MFTGAVLIKFSCVLANDDEGVKSGLLAPSERFFIDHVWRDAALV